MFKIFKEVQKVQKPLGRWALNATKNQKDIKKMQDIKIMLANHDCCGGELCETPSKLKTEIDKIIKDVKSL